MAVAVLQAQQAANIEVITTSAAPGSTAMLPVQQTGTGMLVGQVIDAGTNRPVSSAIVAIGGARPAPPVAHRAWSSPVPADSISAAADRIRSRA